MKIIYRRASKVWLNPLKSANAKDPVHMQMLLLNIVPICRHIFMPIFF